MTSKKGESKGHFESTGERSILRVFPWPSRNLQVSSGQQKTFFLRGFFIVPVFSG